MECVQTDNGFEFTNRFSPSKRELNPLFEQTVLDLGIWHKRITPIRPGTTAMQNAVTGKNQSASTLSPTLVGSWLPITVQIAEKGEGTEGTVSCRGARGSALKAAAAPADSHSVGFRRFVLIIRK